MKSVPVTVAGPDHQDRSRQLSSQISQNVYIARGRGGDVQWVMNDFYGSKRFVTRLSTDRGLWVFNDELYQVSGSTLYKINNLGSSTDCGSVPGVGRCLFADDGVNLYIVTGGNVYRYNGTTTENVTPSVLESPNSIAYLNGFYGYDGDEGRFNISDNGDAATVNPLAVGIANSNGDPIVRVYAYDQLLYLFGTKTIEPWYYSGSGNLNFDRMDQAISQTGLGAVHSLSSDDNQMYFLGDDKSVYRMKGGSSEKISTEQVSRKIQLFTIVSDAIGFCMSLEGQDFYCITFPTADKTFLYSATFNYWVTLSTGMSGGQYLATSYAYCYGRHFVSDSRTGSINYLDDKSHDDAGEARLRVRYMSPITSANMGGTSRRRIVSGGIELDMETGQGLATGQGVDPVLMIDASGDGGYTFQNERFIPIGEMGRYDYKPQYDEFTDGYSIVYRIKCSDPIYLSVFGGYAYITDGGY